DRLPRFLPADGDPARGHRGDRERLERGVGGGVQLDSGDGAGRQWGFAVSPIGGKGMRSVSLTLDEEERQSVLLALAMLSLERPGWDDALNRIALKMDA